MDCKINHKYSFDNYDDIPKLRMRDDLYMVDFRRGFEVIAARAASPRLVKGTRFTEILDIETHGRLVSYLFGYNEKPMLLGTSIGEVLIFAGSFSSTSTFLVSFLNADKDGSLGRVLAARDLDDVLLPQEYPRGKGRLHKRDAELVEDLNYVLKNTLKATKECLIYEYVGNESTVEIFRDIVMSAASLVGCAVELSLSAPPVCNNNFDQSAFRAFLISMLMLCRECAKTRDMRIQLGNCSEGVAIGVEFDSVYPISVRKTSEIEAFRQFAENNQMIFEVASRNETVRVRFCSSRKDWAIIGLKSQVEFDWDN